MRCNGRAMYTTKRPVRSKVIVLKQLLKLIPREILNRLARETRVLTKAWTFSVMSHVPAMLFPQLARALGLSEICDWPLLKGGPLARLSVTPPSRNALTHANKLRYRVRQTLTEGKANIFTYQLILLTPKQRAATFGRIEAWAQIDEEWRRMAFITNICSRLRAAAVSSTSVAGTSSLQAGGADPHAE